jgi:CheY-like chemotaxis protein
MSEISPRILVVDDDSAVALAIVRSLKAPAGAVVVLGRVDAALAALDAGARFDVILSDIRMAPADGIEFYRSLCSRDADLAARLIFVSGSGLDPDVSAFLATIPNRLFTKPFDPKALRGAVAALFEALGPAR